jgi:hypothetical protein
MVTGPDFWYWARLPLAQAVPAKRTSNREGVLKAILITDEDITPELVRHQNRKGSWLAYSRIYR